MRSIPAIFLRSASPDARRRICAMIIALLAAGCAGAPGGKVVDFTVAPDAPTWPPAPEPARFALVGELIGEEDFVDKNKAKQGASRILRAIAGLAIGKRKYRELRRPVAGFTAEDGSVFVADMSLHAIARFDLTQSKFDLWTEAARKEQLVAPSAVISDGAGGLYVSDAEKAEVFRLNALGEPIGRFGAGKLSRPLGLARDPFDGAVFVADAGDHTVKKFSPSGDLILTIGKPGSAPGSLNTPTHLAFADGRLYVADTFNFRIQIFDRAGAELMAFGKNGVTIGDMARPKGVAVGGDGRIYVVESLFDSLLVFDPQTHLLMMLRGEGRKARAFYLPSGVWTDGAGRVYVADMFNGRVVVYQELTPLGPEANYAGAP
jgi:sugar lactone lactonase YvrE